MTLRNNLIIIVIFSIIIICFFIFYFTQIPTVPFHPDEATYLYMSGDLNTLTSDPMQIARIDEYTNPSKHHYRLIDAPLGNYWMGLWVNLGSEIPLQLDWDWSASWEENSNRGALPGFSLLTLGRISSALLFPISLVFAILISKNTYGMVAAYTTFFLVVSNALYLLHTRRAMHESISLVTIYALLWYLPQAKKRPVQLGIFTSLAFNAKQTAIPLIIVSLLLLVLPEKSNGFIANNYTAALKRLAKFGIPFFLIFCCLNPIYWSDPIKRFFESISERQILSQNQYADFAWDSFPYSIPESVLVIVGDIYFRPPSFAESSNYSIFTAPKEAEYSSNPLNNLFRGLLPGAIYLMVTIFGIIISIRYYLKSNNTTKNLIFIYMFAFISQVIFNLIFLNLPWQRYVIPIIPYVILFTSGGIHFIVDALYKKIAPAKILQEQSNHLTI